MPRSRWPSGASTCIQSSTKQPAEIRIGFDPAVAAVKTHGIAKLNEIRAER